MDGLHNVSSMTRLLLIKRLSLKSQHTTSLSSPLLCKPGAGGRQSRKISANANTSTSKPNPAEQLNAKSDVGSNGGGSGSESGTGIGVNAFKKPTSLRESSTLSPSKYTTTTTSSTAASASSSTSSSPSSAAAAAAANAKNSNTSSLTPRSTADKLGLQYLTAAAKAYGRIQDRRPWATQIWASLAVYLCGDMLAQRIDGESYNPYRTIRHLTIGVVAAVPGFTWFMWLGRNFNYPSQILSLGVKIVVNQLVFTTLFNSYFFAMQSLLSGSTVQEAAERVRNTLPTSFVNSWKLWPAVTAFSFTFIRPQFRYLFGGIAAIGWQSYLSWLNQRAAEEERLELAN